jgi:peroxiredoxin
MDKRTFLQYLTAGALAAVSDSAFSQQKPSRPMRHTLSGISGEGKPVTLDDFAGHAILVSFFTAGCNLCANDLKLMREFYTGNRKRNFVLLGVNMDENRDDFIQYMKLISRTVPADQRFPIVWRNAQVHEDSFGVIAKMPTHFVLDKAHRQVLRREGRFKPTDWDDLWTSLE